MRTAVTAALCATLLLAACGGSAKSVSTSGSTTTSAPGAATSSTAGATTTTAELPVSSLPCQPLSFPTGPLSNPNPAPQPALLTKVDLVGDSCVDHVVFDFRAVGTDPPGYTVQYASPPFTADASGAPVDVPGSAFVVVKVHPGYGYDYATGRPTYTGPRDVPITHADHVRAIIETGDFEGVLTWVIGLDARRPFSVQATGTPSHQLVVTVG